jgi:hypothetical protein
MQFDARAAKLLAPGEHLTVDGAPGLRLVCSTIGRAWVYRYKSPVDGRMRQIKLGMWPALSVAQAATQWEQLRSARDAGRDPAQERRELRQREKTDAAAQRDQIKHGPRTVLRLMTEFADLYAAERRKPKGMAELRRMIRTMLGDTGAMRPEDVTRSVAYDLISSHRHIPVQAHSLRRELGAAWEWAHDSGRLADTVPNWWRQIMRGQLASQGKIVGGEHQGVVKRWLTPAEVGSVVRHLPHVSRLASDLLTLYLWTGCRGAEICRMEGREITDELDGWWWTIPKAKLKMARHPLTTDLRVPLIGRALAVALARRDLHGAGHLFPPTRGKAAHVDQKVVGVAVWYHMPGCRLSPESSRARWPVENWAPHDLRRTVRTQLAALGCSHDIAEAVVGHLSQGVAGVYNRHSYDAERREWLTRVVDSWEAAAAR